MRPTADNPPLTPDRGRAEAYVPLRVGPAEGTDVPAVAGAVAALLGELGAAAPSMQALEAALAELIAAPEHGMVLTARAGERLVGVLGASWVLAAHSGWHASIQDLWVDPAWRSREVGAKLLAEICSRARSRSISRVEVGLPTARFAGLAATRAFYEGNGFEQVGPRMRKLLS